VADRKINALGFAWYTQENYERIKTIMEDGHNLPPTFSQWRLAAEQAVKKYRREGFITIEVNIDPDTFPGWCAARGLNVDAKARTEFAALIAKERAADPKGGLH
jgi:hypothetical protein